MSVNILLPKIILEETDVPGAQLVPILSIEGHSMLRACAQKSN